MSKAECLICKQDLFNKYRVGYKGDAYCSKCFTMMIVDQNKPIDAIPSIGGPLLISEELTNG